MYQKMMIFSLTKNWLLLSFFLSAMLPIVSCHSGEYADLVVLNGKIITVDEDFTIAEGLAVKADRIIAVGTDKTIRRFIGEHTRIIDAEGRAVVPGLIDAHLHPEGASLSELENEIPDVHSHGELLEWIKQQAKIKSNGEWIVFPRLFFTRLKEMRPPSLQELDKAAPDNPVFLNGSYGGVINSEAMKLSQITKKTNHNGVVKDKRSGLPTGILKSSAFELLKIPSNPPVSEEQRVEALIQMLRRYNSYGITSVGSGGGNFGTFEMYQNLRDQGKLTTRVFLNIRLPLVRGLTTDELANKISSFKYKTGDGDEWIKVGALKIVLDGGILTGTAYMREPWGERAMDIFGIEDTAYRGILNYSYDELLPIVNTAANLGWKFTVHCTGGGGVDLLLDVFEEVDRQVPLKDRRFSIIHGNFFTPHAIERMHELGIYADAQAAWFYKDADAMEYILGDQRIKTFLPFRSLLDGGVMVNGGSDHMVKFDANTSINPYNPFLGMWAMITRTTEKGSVILPEEAITRAEALKLYTVNNAYASFEEALKGSIEPGKLADIAILSHDLLTCPVDQIKDIKAELTMVGGNIVFSSGKINVADGGKPK
jgi:predicted amidohydrolase YtcJ